MKKKFLVLTLCFTLIFSSFNYKKSYAGGGIISAPILATVSALAVGTGIVIKNSDDLYDLGKMFYDYVDNHNDMTWSTIQALFASSVAVGSNNLVSVDSKFLDVIKGFFDASFSVPNDIVVSGIPTKIMLPFNTTTNYTFSLGDALVHFSYDKSTQYHYNFNLKVIDCTGAVVYDKLASISNSTRWFGFDVGASTIFFKYSYNPDASGLQNWGQVKGDFADILKSSAVTFPYNGGYTWDNVNDRLNENNELLLPIPGDLGNLVGQGSDEFWNNTDNLVGNGDLYLPGVSNPSIGVTNGSFVGSGDTAVPNEGIWANVKDFIISLVVPSDTFWTDTWGGLYGNFVNSFPMVDMDGFNDLVTGEKKFPNIDVNIMGVKGRVVNGDVVNSIVDWLRPIIAGFMMLCLMLFNYRKIYKLIRNSEPFGGIAPGTSDFSTGISEYSKQEVVKATDMVAEYRAWKERGGR